MKMLSALMKRITKQFKDPPDVYSAIHPLYFVCTLFGLAPYKLIRLENGKKQFQFSVWAIIKSVCLVVTFAAFVVYTMIFHREPFSKDIKIKLRYFQEIFSILLTCCSVIFGCIFASRIVEVFKNIDEVDVSFRSLAVWVPYKSIIVNISIQLTALFTLTIGGSVSALLTVFLTDYIGLISIISLASMVIPYIINLVMELQYIHYLNILKMRYKLLNEYLEALVQDDGSYNGWMDEGVTTISKIKKASPATSSLQGSSSGGKIPKSIVAISDPVFIVDQVAALHIKLTDTAHLINQAFCVQQLLRITVAFVSIVTALFLIAANFSKSPSSKEEQDGAQMDTYFTTWAFSNACEVIAVVWISSETCEEANTCPRILHKIRNSTTNTKLQDTIEIYSLQMYHNRLFFTVCGLFPLDYTLLYTIVAGVTTYLVILIQFNNADFIKKVANNSNTEFPNSTI